MWIFAPILVSGIVHMIAVKKNWFRGLNYPIHTRLFGRNKTFRGLVMVPTVAAATGLILGKLPAGLNTPNQIEWLAVLAGTLYVLGELPNSFVKRRFGMQPGQLPRHRLIQTGWRLIDYLDSFVPIAWVSGWLLDWAWLETGQSLVLMIGLAALSKSGLRRAKLK